MLNSSSSVKRKFRLFITTATLSTFIIAACNNTGSQQNMANRDTLKTDGITGADTDYIDFNSPVLAYDEIVDTAIKVRGNNKYSIYNLHEDVVFGFDKSTLTDKAKTELHSVAQSMNKRFKDGKIGIYGYTDSTGTKSYNKNLGKERAASVRDWFMKNENIPADKIAIISFGEANPVASNTTTKGRQENRSVSIVVTPVNKIHTQ
ncbi:MAG: OmpA family protein [Sphingobacteriaceae bacterium]|nr:MAG: OmpA family protein [Sphingobacteriaceae bacterium]